MLPTSHGFCFIAVLLRSRAVFCVLCLSEAGNFLTSMWNQPDVTVLLSEKSQTAIEPVHVAFSPKIRFQHVSSWKQDSTFLCVIGVKSFSQCQCSDYCSCGHAQHL